MARRESVGLTEVFHCADMLHSCLMLADCMPAFVFGCWQRMSLAEVSDITCLHLPCLLPAGCNTHGQLGVGDRQGRLVFSPAMKVPGVVAVQAGDEHSAAVTANGDLYMWGRGDSGQLGTGDGRAKWKPTLLKEFVVVHPDKTLRRNKRNQPVLRPITPSTSNAVGMPFM